MMRFVVLVLGILSLGACASSASQQAQATQPAKRNIEIGDTGNTADAKSNRFGCDSSSTSPGFELFSEGRKRLNGHTIKVSRNPSGGEMTLCEVLNQSGKDAVFFQFAGVTCLECQAKSDFYTQVINSSRFQNIAWVVVLTDFFDDYTESEFQGYMDTYAPDAIRVHDEARLWKALSADPAIPSRATSLAINRNMDAFVVNRNGTPNEKILDAAVELAREVNSRTND